ncbi:MAG: succinate dehydrogenase iron-sulfur subunit, partial [Gammaproteobacteria bacterium]
CPQFNENTGFVGAASIGKLALFNEHPTGRVLKQERLAALMGDGGIADCAYAQNCVEACPKDIPLTRAIASVSGQVMRKAILDLFRS